MICTQCGEPFEGGSKRKKCEPCKEINRLEYVRSTRDRKRAYNQKLNRDKKFSHYDRSDYPSFPNNGEIAPRMQN